MHTVLGAGMPIVVLENLILIHTEKLNTNIIDTLKIHREGTRVTRPGMIENYCHKKHSTLYSLIEHKKQQENHKIIRYGQAYRQLWVDGSGFFMAIQMLV